MPTIYSCALPLNFILVATFRDESRVFSIAQLFRQLLTKSRWVALWRLALLSSHKVSSAAAVAHVPRETSLKNQPHCHNKTNHVPRGTILYVLNLLSFE
jgi:hypothetical protein